VPSEETFRLLAENTPDILCRCSLDMVLMYVSPSSIDVLGWAPEEMIGTGPDHLVFTDDLEHLHEAAKATKGDEGEPTPATVRMRKKDGSLVWIEINPRVLFDAETGQAKEVIVVMRDVNERKHLEQRLEALALTDALTGIGNRRAFDEELACEWKRTLREGSQMSLLLLDIDHFKKFNDANGHQVGDDCLRAVAQAAVGAVRQTDTVARYGGEEIAIILPRVDAVGAMETAEKIRLAIEGLRVTHDGNPEGGGWVSASIGAATALARVGGTMRMPESLLQAADNALYNAKRGGRNRVEAGLLIAPQEAMSV
jgi:diguanylate cyclase (GGDEF)-like protein/PAS domain S-box-containing protein